MPHDVTYTGRWHVRLAADPVTGTLEGDYWSGSLSLADPRALKRAMLEQSWPAGTIFEVERSGDVRLQKAICFLDDLRAWKIDERVLPQGHDAEVPESRSILVQQVTSDLARLMSEAANAGLCSEDEARSLWRAAVALFRRRGQ